MSESDAVYSYRDFIERIREKKLGIILYKDNRAAISAEAFRLSSYTGLLFLLQFIMPVLFIIIYSYINKAYWGLMAIPFYLAVPFIIPQSQTLSIATTTFGLFGMVWHWPALVICLLTPALLYSWGDGIWWGSLQLVLVRGMLKDKTLFDRLWQGGLIAIHDYQGNLYQCKE